MEEPIKIPLYDGENYIYSECSVFQLYDIIRQNQDIQAILEKMRMNNQPMLASPERLKAPHFVAPAIYINQEKTFLMKEDALFCMNAANPEWGIKQAEYWRDDVFYHIKECVMAYVGPSGRDVVMMFPGIVEGLIENKDEQKAVDKLMKAKLQEIKKLLGMRYADSQIWKRTMFMFDTHHTISHDPGAKIRYEYFVNKYIGQ
jgi:hypothetical protein